MKISQKDLDLLVDSMMNEIYDRNYVATEKDKIAKKESEKFMKLSRVKNLLKIFEIDNIKSVELSDDFFKWTPAESKNKYAHSNYVGSVESLDNTFQSKVRANTKIDYPDEWTVRNKLRSTLAVELIWGKDLKKALTEVSKSIKKEFKLS